MPGTAGTDGQPGAVVPPAGPPPSTPDGAQVGTPVVAPLGFGARFRQGVAWNMVAVIAKQGSTFAVGIVLANMLGRELFGQYAAVLSTAQTMAVLAGLSTGYTATKYVAELRSTDPERAGRILALCGVVAAVAAVLLAAAVLFAAPLVGDRVMGAPELTPLLRVAAAVIAATALAGFFSGGLAGLESYRALGRAALIGSTAHVGASLGGAALWGLHGAVYGLVVSSLVHLAVLVASMRREAARQGISIRPRQMGAEKRVLWVFALPGALSGLTAMPAIWLGHMFLARQPEGFAQLAGYSAAYSLMAMVLLIPHVANQVGMSLLNHALGGGRAGDYRRVFWLNLATTLALVVAGASVLSLVGRPVLALYGSSFASAYPVLLVLLLATVPEGLTVACNQVLQSRERMWQAILLINLPRDFLLIGLAWHLAALHGALGLAMAYLAARTLACCIMLMLTAQLGLDPSRHISALRAAA